MSKEVTGTFEADAKGGGRLRAPELTYQARKHDPLILPAVGRALHLRGGESIVAQASPGARNGAPQIARREDLKTINGRSVEEYTELKPFDELTAVNPDRRIHFEIPGGPLSMRVVDLLTPIGFGQRGLVVAPPRTGKTVLLQQMAAGVAANHPNLYMIVLLIDERPEEVTEMRRSVHGEVVASCNDLDVESHVRLARIITQKAKRLVECGRDVLILLDSLTRLGRAFNSRFRGAGRIMSGGLDSRALTEPKAVFGSARNVEEGGSLTIIASCLIETGSRMDEVIFNEFKGTGNMEITLSREMANRRLWPAIDLTQSGTRKEELLLSQEELLASQGIRRVLFDRGSVRSMDTLLAEMGKFPDNRKFVAEVAASRAR